VSLRGEKGKKKAEGVGGPSDNANDKAISGSLGKLKKWLAE